MHVPAFGWARFDARPPLAGDSPDDGSGDDDVLLAEALHGRLDRDGWIAVDAALSRARPLADAAAERAAGLAFWELSGEELSVLGEPGTVGALLREIGRLDDRFSGHVLAALHHRRPALVPHLTRTTRRAMLPFLEEGDSGVDAVVHRELRAEPDAFAALETAVAARTGVTVTRLRLHDILLWLSTTLRLPAAVALGRSADP